MATRAEIHLRTAEVSQWLLQGFGRAAILQKAAEKWGTKERTTQEYLARARDLIEEQFKERLGNLTQEIIERLNLLYLVALGKKDVHGARACLWDMAKLAGLDQRTLNVNVTRNDQLKDWTNEDLDRAMEEYTH